MNNTHIEAPFSEAEIKALKEWQSGEKKFPFVMELPQALNKGGELVMVPGHPFTCGTPEGCPHGLKIDENGYEYIGLGMNKLIPTPGGLLCPCGQYIQSWCYNFMAGYDDDDVCQECGRGHVLAVGMTQPNGTQNYECDNCGNHQSFP